MRRRSCGGGSPSGGDDGDDDVGDVGVFPGPASAGSSRSRCLDDPQLSPPDRHQLTNQASVE